VHFHRQWRVADPWTAQDDTRFEIDANF